MHNRHIIILIQHLKVSHDGIVNIVMSAMAKSRCASSSWNAKGDQKPA
jgi:hypothetical protein